MTRNVSSGSLACEADLTHSSYRHVQCFPREDDANGAILHVVLVAAIRAARMTEHTHSCILTAAHIRKRRRCFR